MNSAITPLEPIPKPAGTHTGSNETAHFLRQFSSILEEWEGEPVLKAPDGGALRQIIRDLDRARRQFDSKLFLLVIFGSLKAGKSTLTNALAGQHVSPSGFGHETTLRPSLILRGEEDVIEQYLSTDPEIINFLLQCSKPVERFQDPPVFNSRQDTSPSLESDSKQKELFNKVRNTFDDITDYLRGIRDLSEIRSIRVKREPISSLTQLLTDKLLEEPLLTVIRIRGSEILKDGLAIVDMPGLDGTKSNWRDNPIHEWVIKRAEFFLFVQSSIAAINKETCEFLKSIVARTNHPPVFVIQNIFEADHWRPEHERKKEQEDQRQRAQQTVEGLLKCATRSVKGLNLGKAWDGIRALNGESEQWLQESGFPEFQKDLSEVLHSGRAVLQEKNNLKGADHSFRVALETLKRERDLITQLRTGYSEEIGRLNRRREALEGIDYQHCKTACRDLIESKAQAITTNWQQEASDSIGSMKTRLNREHFALEVNAMVEAEGNRLARSGTQLHLDPESILPEYTIQLGAHCGQAESGLVETLGQPPKPSHEDIPVLHDGRFSHRDMEANRAWRYFWEIRWDAADIGNHLEEVVRDWTREIKERSSEWRQQFLNQKLSEYLQKRRQYFRSTVDAQIQQIENEAKPKLERARVMEEAIAKLEVDIRSLNEALQDALVNARGETLQ